MKNSTNFCLDKRGAALPGIAILFAVLFISQCITVPAMYETAETKKEMRTGVSVQYREGSYTVPGFFGNSYTRYYYKYGGARVDFSRSKKFGEAIEVGYDLGEAIVGYNETPDKTRGTLLQVDARAGVKIVTPTKPVRLGLKIAPGLLFDGGIVVQETTVIHPIGGLLVFPNASLLFGIGRPEFLTVGLNLYYFMPYMSLTYHYKNTSFSLCFIPRFYRPKNQDYSLFFSLGLGWHY